MLDDEQGEKSMDCDYLVKVVFVGPSKAGKSCALAILMNDCAPNKGGSVSSEYRPTNDIDMGIAKARLASSNEEVKLQVWDTAGQESVYTNTTMKIYCRGAAMIALCLNLSDYVQQSTMNQSSRYQSSASMFASSSRDSASPAIVALNKWTEKIRSHVSSLPLGQPLLVRVNENTFNTPEVKNLVLQVVSWASQQGFSGIYFMSGCWRTCEAVYTRDGETQGYKIDDAVKEEVNGGKVASAFSVVGGASTPLGALSQLLFLEAEGAISHYTSIVQEDGIDKADANSLGVTVYERDHSGALDDVFAGCGVV